MRIQLTIPTVDKNYDFVLFTDGGYSQKSKIGTLGYVALENNKMIFEGNKYLETIKTSQQAELQAVICSLKTLKSKLGINTHLKEILIKSDSKYVVNCGSLRWSIIENLGLWQEFFNIKNSFKLIDLVWVKGHNNDEYNERADELATLARQEQEELICQK